MKLWWRVYASACMCMYVCMYVCMYTCADVGGQCAMLPYMRDATVLRCRKGRLIRDRAGVGVTTTATRNIKQATVAR